jgi:hypothetical protein
LHALAFVLTRIDIESEPLVTRQPTSLILLRSSLPRFSSRTLFCYDAEMKLTCPVAAVVLVIPCNPACKTVVEQIPCADDNTVVTFADPTLGLVPRNVDFGMAVRY